MKMFQMSAFMVLTCALLLASCSKQPEKDDAAASKSVSNSEGGALQTVIEYGTGARHVKAGLDASQKLKAIDAARQAQMEDVAE